MEYDYYKASCNLYLRENPGSAHDVTGSLEAGEIVTVDETKVHRGTCWVHVCGEKSGWVNEIFLREIGKP